MFQVRSTSLKFLNKSKLIHFNSILLNACCFIYPINVTLTSPLLITTTIITTNNNHCIYHHQCSSLLIEVVILDNPGGKESVSPDHLCIPERPARGHEGAPDPQNLQGADQEGVSAPRGLQVQSQEMSEAIGRDATRTGEKVEEAGVVT